MSQFVVTANALNLRVEPSINAAVEEVLNKGDVVTALESSADGYWQKISTNGKTGWAAFKYLQPVMDHVVISAYPWFDIAENELGVAEIPGPASNTRIVEYLKSTTLRGSATANNDETPWCSAFVNYCVEKAGYAGTDSASARSWQNWGKPTQQPTPGCIAVFRRDPDPSNGHVAFFVSENGGVIKVLGGNQSDKVCYAEFPSSRLLSYRIPR